jgi:very-short-patch-repair endonuclease
MRNKEKPLLNFYYNTLRARDLRKKETKAEKILWDRIRNRQINGLKFRRQHPIGYYIPDFFCYEKSLIIELEGKVHEELEQKEYDQVRKEVLKEWTYKIIFFKNEEIYNEIETVLEKIKVTAKSLKSIEIPLS